MYSVYLSGPTNGQFNGEITLLAEEWKTRNGWGHVARVWENGRIVVEVKRRYYNRTWERYTYQSVLHDAIAAYVERLYGRDPLKGISDADKRQRKSAAAEMRRVHRVEEAARIREVYKKICGVIDSRHDRVAA